METASFLNQWSEQEVEFNKRDLLLYAFSLGAKLQYTYEYASAGFAAFPTYPLCLGFKGNSFDVVSPAMMAGPKMPPLPGVKVVLDGERHIEMFRPLNVEGEKLNMKTRFIGVHKKGSGAFVESETLFLDSKGQKVYRLVSGSFMVGAKDFADSGITNSEEVKVPKRDPDGTVEYKTLDNSPLLFRLNGDYNPLHVDEDLAQMSGFQKPIMHGLNSYGICCNIVLENFVKNPALFKAMKGRFSSPVLPGQTLVVRMWKEQPGRVVFTASVKETGKVAISNAYVVYNEPSAKL